MSSTRPPAPPDRTAPAVTLAAAETAPGPKPVTPSAAAGGPTAQDHCPRCGGRFVCGMSAPGPCACTTVKLTASTLSAINRRWQHCLCLACLQALAAGEPLALNG